MIPVRTVAKALIFLALGAGVFAYQVKTRPTLSKEIAPPPPRLVETRTVAYGPYRPVVRGHGEVAPVRSWTLRAPAAGHARQIHPHFRAGGVIPAGEVILALDPERHAHRVGQQEAALAELRARREEMVQNHDLDRRRLELEERAVSLARAELERNRKLEVKGTGSRSERDAAEVAMLARESALVELERLVGSFPQRLAQAESQIRAAEARLADLRQEQADARLTAPATVRVVEGKLAEGQYLTLGQSLGEVIDPAALEVRVSLDPREAVLLGPVGEARGLPATVHWAPASLAWPGQATRVEGSLDPASRQLRVTVALAPAAAEGDRVPPPPGAYVEVAIQGEPLEGVAAVPRALLREGRLLVVENGRLREREVAVRALAGEEALIAGGLQPGDALILTALPGAVPGMAVKSQADLPAAP